MNIEYEINQLKRQTDSNIKSSAYSAISIGLIIIFLIFVTSYVSRQIRELEQRIDVLEKKMELSK